MLKFIKLLNGEEIVAEVDGDQEWSERLEMRRPYRNLITQQGSILVPYPCDVISVSTGHVLFTGDPSADLSTAYCDATGKIAVPRLQVPRM